MRLLARQGLYGKEQARDVMRTEANGPFAFEPAARLQFTGGMIWLEMALATQWAIVRQFILLRAEVR
jgi:hypothetical protein